MKIKSKLENIRNHIAQQKLTEANIQEAINWVRDANCENLTHFLGKGKIYGRFSSVAEIDDFVAENRETWLQDK